MMKPPSPDALRRLGAAVLLAGCFATSSAVVARAGDWSWAYTLDVHDVSAPVGQDAVMVATIQFASGCRVLEAYNNRAMLLSAIDDGVVFDRKSIPAEIKDGALVFAIGVHPTKPGTHKINAVLRIGYIEGEDTMKMVNVPLIANVIGTE
jgi:hypothetical protein